MSLTNPDSFRETEQDLRIERRLNDVTDRLLDQAGWPPDRTGWIGWSVVDGDGRYDPLQRRHWMTRRAKGYRLKVDVPEVPDGLPSPGARRAVDLLRAVRAALS